MLMTPLAHQPRYASRRYAGRVLAEKLCSYVGRDDVLVLGLPRGGFAVAHEVATALDVALDIFVVRTLPVPRHPPLTMGAIASGDVRVLDEDIARWYRVPRDVVDSVTAGEQALLARTEEAYRHGRPAEPIEGKVIVLVDDGLASASTMKAAVTAVRRVRPSRVIVAVPVGAANAYRELLGYVADDVVCARVVDPLTTVGAWYDEPEPTADAEVAGLLQRARHHGAESKHVGH